MNWFVDKLGPSPGARGGAPVDRKTSQPLGASAQPQRAAAPPQPAKQATAPRPAAPPPAPEPEKKKKKGWF